MTVKHLTKNGYVGNQRENIPLLALLDTKYVRHIEAVKIKLRNMKCVVQVVETFARM